ncbi:MAG TPA: TRAP transporter permease [Eubacteriales bacterium]|nr:TRAP transporter permease [Eubacteriales bacterium]
MKELIKENEKSKLVLIVDIVIGVVSVIGALFHFYIAYSTSIGVAQQRVFHTFLFIFIYFLYNFRDRLINKKTVLSVINLICVIVSLLIGIYYVIGMTNTLMLDRAINGASTLEIIMGVILMIMILELARRKVGLALTILSLIFILYAMFGRYMPAVIAHKGYSLSYITEYVAWTTEGIFGTPIGASVSFVCLYIILGELLDVFGAGRFFIDIAYALTGRMKGGPAEAAVVSSAFMGSINGSAVANVVTTGTFTIPLMKKVGYKPEYAGAVEAVASTGGQILPPVMGAAAFVMADLTGIPYSSIIIAALIPGLLYYIALGVAVYLEADKLGLKGEPKERLPQVLKVLKNGWFFSVPIIVLLVCLLGFQFSANYSAVFAIISLLIIGTIKTLVQEKRFPFKELYEACKKSMKTTIAVAIACAAAGIVIGIVSMTGIGVKFTRIVFDLAGGNVFFMLVLIMVACLIMGMGLPSTAAYIIAATIGVPPLVEVGIPLLAANMFVFYFAIVSFITPPVALAAYAGAGIADSKPGKTGVQAFLLGLSGFIIPYVYVYNPALLIIDAQPWDVIYIMFLALIAVCIIGMSVTGWLNGKIKWPIRLLMFVSAIMMFIQGYAWTDYVGLIVGIATVVLTFIFNGRKRKRQEANDKTA